MWVTSLNPLVGATKDARRRVRGGKIYILARRAQGKEKYCDWKLTREFLCFRIKFVKNCQNAHVFNSHFYSVLQESLNYIDFDRGPRPSYIFRFSRSLPLPPPGFPALFISVGARIWHWDSPQASSFSPPPRDVPQNEKNRKIRQHRRPCLPNPLK